MPSDLDKGQTFLTVYPSIFPLSFLTSLYYYPNHQLNSPLHLIRRKSLIRISLSPPSVWFLHSVNQMCQQSLLTTLTSVGLNHFYVMLLLSQGCSFIQSLLFSYVLREDSVKFSRIYFGSLSAVRTTWYSVRTLISQQHCPDDEIFLSGRPSVSRSFEQFKIASVRM